MDVKFLHSKIGRQRGILVLAIFYYLFLGYIIYIIIPEFSHVCTYRDILGLMAFTLFLLSFLDGFKSLLLKSIYLFFVLSLGWVLHVVSETQLSVESGLLVLIFLIIVSLGIPDRKVFQWFILIFSLSLLVTIYTSEEAVIPGPVFFGIYLVTAFINYLLISNFQRMQYELKDTVKNLRLLLNQVDECFILLDSEFRVLKFNKKAYETIRKYQNIELKKGVSFSEYYRDNSLKNILESLGKSRDHSIRFDHKSIYSNNNTRVVKWYDIKFFPVHTEDGNLDNVVFTALDITDRYESSEKLIRSGKMFKKLFQKAPIGMALSDMDGKVIEVNDAYCETIGYPMEEVLNRTFTEYTHPDDIGKNYELFQSLLESEIKEYQLEKRYVQKSGRTIHVIVRVILLADLDGKDQLLAQVIDITRLKKVEDVLKIKNLELLEGNINLEKTNLELERKNMELDRFIYSASHDLRAPLLSLKGLINITKMEIGDTNKMYFDLMEKSIDKLDNFIGEIIQFSANESTQIHEEHVPDFESVIKENYERLRYSIGADNISLIINSTIDQSFIIDRQRLEIILSNLLSNGIKYHDPQKQKQFIEINSCIEGNMLNIDVKDNGIGIPDNRQDRVFDFFYRAHDHSFGAGLGLYIVRQTIKKLNGRISLLSKVGIGSTFLIELPVRFDIDQKIVA